MLLDYQQALAVYNQAVQQNDSLILLVWLIGLGCVLGSYLVRHCLFFMQLKLDLCPYLKKYLPENVGAYSANLISTPFSSGYFSPFIAVPKSFKTHYTYEQQQMIIAHELEHIKRGDLYWNLLVMLFQSVFWFNPFVWYALKHFYLCQEVSCDERVLSDKTKHQKLEYSKALLVSPTNDGYNSPMSAAFSEQGFYSCRLMQILTPSVLNKNYLLPSLTLLILISVFTQFSVNTLANFTIDLVKPIMRILPAYPAQAAANDIEGFAIASFTINKNGQTENIQINLSQPVGTFDDEVMSAIKTWQYTKPDRDTDKIEVQLSFRNRDNQPLELVKKGIEGIVVMPSYSK
ncbi:M56 family metallopeptidase [Catenovulum sp. SX2]|uniref:M56 family metallopeptidase n=1 Tax=Catenovulum sp. SX2 TaxID=3398614 RepID=UPI003F861537